MSRKPEKCPNCGHDLLWDEVDIEVGVMTSPAWCENPDCGYSEEAFGLVEPDGRVPTSEVPMKDDVDRAWSEVPLASEGDHD